MFDIPNYVGLLIDRLEEEGYEAYIVGGSIRDIALGRKPEDYDMATDARPQDVKDIFSDYKTIDIGKSFGTILVCQAEGNVEITTFRKEGAYRDGRRPDWVHFSPSIKDDLSRRDFTINAMAYSRKKGIIDPYDGRYDLKNKIIRTVGNPEKRFNEDYLRILRAVRFASQLQFQIEELTLKAGKKHCEGIRQISWERIAREFFKILLCTGPSAGIRLLDEIGALDIILPEMIPSKGFNQRNPHHEMDVFNHILCVLDNSPPVIEIRLAALFHDIGKAQTLTVDEDGIGHFYNHERLGADISRDVLVRFKASNDLIEKVFNLVKDHMTHHVKFQDKGLKRLIGRLGENQVFDLLNLQIADVKCSRINASIDHLIQRRERLEEIIRGEEAYGVKQLHIDGYDLIELGFKEGPIIGEILEHLLGKVMETPSINNKELLKSIALNFKKQEGGY